jgi:hypothetical protein
MQSVGCLESAKIQRSLFQSTSPDPGGLSAVNPSNPQSWNRYAYVLNDPLSNIDPLGLDCVRDNGDGTTTTYTDAQDNCEGDNGYYFDGTVSRAFLDANKNVGASVNGQFQCAGDSGCSMYNNLTSVTVNGGPADMVRALFPELNAPFVIASAPITTATITNVPNGKQQYCSDQANNAALAKLIPGGDILYQHQFTPEAAAAAGISIATDVGADVAKDSAKASLLSWLKNSAGVSGQTAGRIGTALKVVGYLGSAYNAYQALKAMQAEYAYCMQ